MRTRSLNASARSAPCLFGLWVVGLCALYVSLADGREVSLRGSAQLDRLSLAQAVHSEPADDASILMSCAEEPSSNNEPLWCAHPDSPHCTRGTPVPSSAESWLGPVFASTTAALARPRLISVHTASTPSPAALLGHAQTDAERLERPPRRA